MTMGARTRKRLFKYESIIWSFFLDAIDMTKFRGIIYRHFWFDDVVEEYFGVNSTNPYKDLTDTTIAEKIHYRRWFGKKCKDGTPFYHGQGQL